MCLFPPNFTAGKLVPQAPGWEAVGEGGDCGQLWNEWWAGHDSATARFAFKDAASLVRLAREATIQRPFSFSLLKKCLCV